MTSCPRPTREAAHGCGLPGAGGMSGCPVIHVRGRLCSEPCPGLETIFGSVYPFHLLLFLEEGRVQSASRLAASIALLLRLSFLD